MIYARFTIFMDEQNFDDFMCCLTFFLKDNMHVLKNWLASVFCAKNHNATISVIASVGSMLN